MKSILLFGIVLLLGVSISARATVITIGTGSAPNGAVGAFGEGVPSPNVATFGQIVTAPISGYLTGFSFTLKSYISSSDLPYNPTPLIGYVAQWQGPSPPSLGSPNLYQSNKVSFFDRNYSDISFDTSVSVSAGAQYVLYLSSSGLYTGTNAELVSLLTDGDAYSGGGFVASDTRNDLSSLYTKAWTVLPQDLVFSARFSDVAQSPTSSVPEPATWPMLLLGLFGFGFLIHGARFKKANAAA